MDIKTEISFDNGTPDFTFSLLKQRYIELDGEKHYVGEPSRRAVAPGDINLAIDFIHDGKPPNPRARKAQPEHGIIKILRGLWTDKIIEDYRRKIPHQPDELAESDGQPDELDKSDGDL